jgi:methionine-rich copper-binding protein CopC
MRSTQARRCRIRPPRARKLWALSATAAVLLGTATPAQAHTTLKSASPASGSTVPSPARIVLTYDDPVIVPRVILTDAAGGRHESGPAQAVDNTVTQQVGGRLTPGVYKVGWRVVASDGHPVSGEYRFTVRGDASAAGASASPGASAPPAAGSARTAKGSAGPATYGSSGSGSPGSGGLAGWWWAALAIALAAVAGGAMALRRRRSG